MNIKHILGARSHFSIGESMLSPKQIIEGAKKVGAESVALVDTMTISGMVDFTSAAKKAGIKPIIGCRLRVVEDPTYRKPKKASGEKEKANPEWYPKVYVKNADGMTDLIKLLSKANTPDYFYYVARIGLEDLLETLGKGNLALSTGDFYSVFHMTDYASIIDRITESHSATETFIEITPIDTPLFVTLNSKALNIAAERNLPTLATYPIMYEGTEDAETLQVLAAVTSNTKMSAPWRSIQFVQDFCFRPLKEQVTAVVALRDKLATYSPDTSLLEIRASLGNMDTLVGLCNYKWEKQPVTLPKMAENEMGALILMVKEGWAHRLGKETMGYKPKEEDLPIYRERLKYELGILKEMKFERYFLLVEDLVSWAKNSGIMVGPGRGSAGGSLVAYLLGIVDVDPIRFGLIFERFINPDRLDLPDVDLDFMSSRRGEVIEYLVKHYGEDRVAGISNYQTMASASALRDTARVYDLPSDQITCTRYVPKEHGSSVELEVAAEQVPEIAAFKEEHGEIWNHATNLEGVMRNLGKHAAGVVVAGEPITNRAVVEIRSKARIVNWDKRTVEDWGLIKMDILGLSTLDTITKALNLIKEHTGKMLELTSLPLDDEKVITAFGEGDTIGIFQFESGGMRKLLKSLAEDGALTFDDVVATTALYRPGPMDAGLMDDYVAIKNGSKMPYYDHDNMKNALESTNSVIVYQEQVMQVARDLAGFTMTEADHLRKAMGKKDKEKMAAMRDQWVSGCGKTSGLDPTNAELLFDKIEKFAGYGFNKSHAVEYSIISYWAMWLKVYHRQEFYAASLSVAKEDKLPGIVKDAESNGIYVIPPDINKSGMDFESGYDEKREQHVLYTPFNRLKGLSDNTTRAILAAREGREKFTSKEDFLKSVNKTKCNKRHQEVLDKTGAFADVELEQIPARHPDRLKEQMQLMPGLIVQSIKADRDLAIASTTRMEIAKLVDETRHCERCTLAGGIHPETTLGKAPKFMVVTDAPNWSEEQNSKMMKGKACEYLETAIKDSGLKLNNGYYTSLVKSPKNEKQLTNEQINGCSGYLKREIELLKPAVIIALGSGVIRHFVPDVKGGVMDLTGQVVYVPELDASIVFGISPGMISFDPAKSKDLQETFERVKELLE
ncbi:MAG: DNA polymerase III subunit alpha [Piscirickettsiaceae bacterium]|nr:DNA polymerase III subunit alpha [Piscirickettsiaceae bacterium]